MTLEDVLELDLVDQAGLKLIEFHLPVPPECWVKRHEPPLQNQINKSFFFWFGCSRQAFSV